MPPIARHSDRPLSFSILLIFAVLLYSGLAVFLFRPWLDILKPREYLTPFNSILGAAGCFLLSRRWLASFDASAIAGAAYGFGPFVLSFQIYHPLAGLSVALLPWFFCPAALWNRYGSGNLFLQLKRPILLLIPFVGIILFFWLPAQSWAGPYDLMPRTQQFQLADLPPLIGFPDRWGNQISLGLYPNVFIPTVMGIFVYLALLRISVLVPVLAGLVLSFFPPFLSVPPVVWLAIPMLFLCILAGLGTQAFAWGGLSDQKWILCCVLVAAVLMGICLFSALTGQSGGNIRFSTLMYGVAFLTASVIFLLAKGQRRWHLFRWILITAAVGIDVFLTGRLILTALS